MGGTSTKAGTGPLRKAHLATRTNLAKRQTGGLCNTPKWSKSLIIGGRRHVFSWQNSQHTRMSASSPASRVPAQWDDPARNF